MSSRPSDRKPSAQHPDSKMKREERRESAAHAQSYRKDSRSADSRDSSHHYDRHRDVVQTKLETNVNGRAAAGSASHAASRSHHDSIKTEEHKDSANIGPEISQTPASVSSMQQHSVSNSSVMDGVKRSKTSIDFSEYIKRKEQERKESSDRTDREKLKQREADILNRTFSETNLKELKHRPPKLDISLPLPESLEHKTHSKDKSERPYSVNIKSPIKPHHNITVKSPIKSSDLKQPKLEIPKVQITPEKDGSDPFSVNINSDPAIRKLMENSRQEIGSSVDNSDEHDSFPNINDNNDLVSHIKQEPSGDLEPGEILEPEIALKPEHSVAPDFKIRELGYDPDNSSSRLLLLKQESTGSLVSDPISGSTPPLKTKLPSGNSPLKIKISTKGLSTDSDHSSGKHSSPHRHKHKHKDKHKSHKHSRDKEKHRDKHRDKHGSDKGTNGQSSLKMSIKLSDIPSASDAGGEHWSVKHKHDKHKHRASVSDPSLNKSGNLTEQERQQPWSMSDLITNSGSAAMSPSRKRRRTPTVDTNVEHTSNSKAAKTASNRIRRSSSSHSVVSMELSDGEDGQINGPQIQTNQQLNLLNASLMQAIAQTKNNILKRTQEASGKRSHSNRNSPREAKPSIDRQQSGFDLEGMMWAGSGVNDVPPLPPGNPPPPPPTQVQPPPPPTR